MVLLSKNHLDSRGVAEPFHPEDLNSRGWLNTVYSSEVTFPQATEPHAENVFLPRYHFCSGGTVKEDRLLSLYPC